MAEMIAIAKLRRDGGTQSRAMLDPSTVEIYAEDRREGATFPAVVVFHDGTNHWLADGFHRAAGFEAAGETEIEADIRVGTQRDAILFACGANANHGLRRTTDDKRRAVILLLRDEEWSQWSDHEIARRAHVSQPFVGKLRALTDNVISERKFQTKHGAVATMDTAAIGRNAAAQATLRSVPVEALTQFLSEQHRAKQEQKKARREEREQQLGEKIAASNVALAAAGASGKRYGVILADPEWRFEAWSDETGMDRAADNHYPTTPTDEICARPVRDIAADDALLLLWATVPMLPDALKVMAAWGFTYRSHAVWLKDKVGTGYWFRNQHELLLVGTRGNLPAPAMGTQLRSALAYPVGAHSEKPPFAHEIAEAYCPSLPKIELNAREARPGWDVWGAEAPALPASGGVVGPGDYRVGEQAPGSFLPADHPAVTFVGVDLSRGPDQTAEWAPPSAPEPDEPKAKPPAKMRKAKEPKRDSWQVEHEERAKRIDLIAADLPDDLAALTAAYAETIDRHHDAVMRESAEEAHPLRERMEAILFKANGCTNFGVGCNDAPMSIRRASWAPVGTVPKWGQVGQFILEHRDIRAIICFGDHEGIHAVEFNRPFPSETGFHSIGATRLPGMTVEDYGRAMIDGALAYVPGGGKGKPRKPVRPEHAYRLAVDERGYLQRRERGERVTPVLAKMKSFDVDALDAMATEWRAEDRARLISEKKGKRKFPESRRYDDKIIALVDGALVPQADFPTAGAYVVSDYQWEGEEKITGWRYVADATRLDDPAEIAGAA